ncbi:hypothetical protein EDC04DRAFT_234902 [Pisolithus marmoratus]|nr:hypothetical protein EDC04DRAFT_234902 [Pisolithus marmoratus]
MNSPKLIFPPPPGAHIMAPQVTAYDGSGTRQQAAAPSSTSTHAHTRQVQPLTTSHSSTNASQNFSPTGASAPQQAMFSNAPTQRVAYDPPRQGYDQASSRAYDTRGYDQSSSRGYDQTSSRVYDQTSSRTAYDGSHRSGYDPTAAATSTARSATYDSHAHPQQQRPPFENSRPSAAFGQNYVSDSASASGSYHHPDTSSHPAQPHGSYGHASEGGYVGTQQQHTQPSPTHAYPPQQAPSSQQHSHSHNHPLPNIHPNVHTHPGTHNHAHTHESQYSSHPPTAPARYSTQFGASAMPGFGHSQPQTAGYTSGHYSSQQQQHQPGPSVGGGSAAAYYESSQAHPSTHQGESSTTQQQAYFGAGTSTQHPQLNPNHNHTTSSPPSWGSQSSTYDYGEFYAHSGPSTGAQTTRSESTPAHGPGPSPTSVGPRYGGSSTQAGAPPTQTVYGGHPPGHSHLHSPFGANASASSTYTNTSLSSSSANATHEWAAAAGNQGQGPARPPSNTNANNMIHLAPLRHVVHTGAPSASPTPSSPGAVGAGGMRGAGPSGYPSLVPHSHPQVHGHGHAGTPFEHEGGGRGIPASAVGSGGKKSVLSIGSIISEGG